MARWRFCLLPAYGPSQEWEAELPVRFCSRPLVAQLRTTTYQPGPGIFFASAIYSLAANRPQYHRLFSGRHWMPSNPDSYGDVQR